MKNKFVIYTALFGDYDDLIDPKEKYDGCDFICFTDQEHLVSNIWDIRVVKDSRLSRNMMNRQYKILPHIFLSDYEFSLYLDANIKLNENPVTLRNKYLIENNNNFVMPKHFLRDCIYEEAKECVVLKKSSYLPTKSQMSKYKKDEFPAHFGLGENNILLRRHNELSVIKIMNEWWDEINNETQRDQLSLAYIMWKNKMTFSFMAENARGNSPYFEYFYHKENINFLDKIKNKVSFSLRRLYFRNKL